MKKIGFLREILKNGVVDDSKKCDFIGLICFQVKNGGKNEQKFVFFCIFWCFFAFFYKKLSEINQKCTCFEHHFLDTD